MLRSPFFHSVLTPVLPANPPEIGYTQQQADQRGGGDGQTDLKHTRLRQAAEKIRQRHADQERGEEALQHDKPGSPRPLK